MALKLMYIGICVILVLFQVVYNTEIEPGQTFLAEISKNISLVNHLLQDLMKKYKLLQHLTNAEMAKIAQNTNSISQGGTRSDFKIRAKEKVKEPKKTVSTTTEFQTDQSTEYSSSEVDQKKPIQNKKTNDNGNLSRDSKVQLSHIADGKALYFNDESEENITTEVTDMKVKYLSGSQEHTFVTEKSRITTTHTKMKLKENVKHKVLTTTKKYRDDEILRGQPEEIKDPQGVKKVLVIHLEGGKNLNQNQGSDPKDVNTPSTRNKQRTTKSILFKSDITEFPSDFDDNNRMQAELSRAKVLRQALGDACIRLVNQKCKNALNDVLTDICKRDRKCSGAFNKDFTGNANRACDEEFGNPSLKKRRHDKYFRDSGADSRNEDEELTGTQFVDYTRQGLLDIICPQTITDETKPKLTARTNLTNIDSKHHKVHILRDKLEDACRKSSFDKCQIACKSASKKTCKKHECITEKEKALGVRCKKRCMERYEYSEKESSESESETEESESD
ncbi:uncharacterized protein LOC125237228 [Leguminivora glycinivorella]|uniref:uncharacterized protein LOC125237228 n=1 Tax=Leguminivora glycinivorella TaxID=1035111 RepID=UPI00200EAE78|nr:uncharacterized protein LOC125237228 [Leguminivora glycinivorella]